MAELPPVRGPSRVTDDRAGRQEAPSGETPPRLQPRLWWLGVALLLFVNYVVTQLFFQAEPAVSVSYTFFKQQVTGGKTPHLQQR